MAKELSREEKRALRKAEKRKTKFGPDGQHVGQVPNNAKEKNIAMETAGSHVADLTSPKVGGF